MENKDVCDEACLSDEDIFDDRSSPNTSTKSVEANSQLSCVSGRRDDDNTRLRCRLTGVPPPPSITDARQFDVDAVLQLWNRHHDSLSFVQSSGERPVFHSLGLCLNEDSSCEEYELLLLKLSEWYNSTPTASTCLLPPVKTENDEDINQSRRTPIDYLKSKRDAVKMISGPWRLSNRTVVIKKIDSKTNKTTLMAPPAHPLLNAGAAQQVPKRPPEILDPLKKRKLMWAVSTSLKQRGVRLSHPEFKVKFSRLYSKTVAAWLSGEYSVKSSTSDAMLALANRLS